MISELHPSIVTPTSLAANIAASHPEQGLCQVERLTDYGVSREQDDTVIEIARHIRNEVARQRGASFDDACAAHFPRAAKTLAAIAVTEGGICRTPTPSGKPCC